MKLLKEEQPRQYSGVTAKNDVQSRLIITDLVTGNRSSMAVLRSRTMMYQVGVEGIQALRLKYISGQFLKDNFMNSKNHSSKHFVSIIFSENVSTSIVKKHRLKKNTNISLHLPLLLLYYLLGEYFFLILKFTYFNFQIQAVVTFKIQNGQWLGTDLDYNHKNLCLFNML